ncbi:ATP-binding cassette domain-containing protein [Actinomadura verrucosospora]
MSPTPTPAAGAARPLLSLRGVSKSFGAVAALTGVDLDVAAGEVVALVGDNGAGKSTLVKVLSGVHAPDAGTITFESREVSIPTPAAAQQLGIATVFQDLALCENLNVIENLFLGREMRALRLDDVAMEVRSRELLTQLSAKIPSVGVPVAALSGGQRQTVAIARSLLGDPKVIILDEPTAALGVAQTAEVLNLIERLRERGHGVLMISHNMADVQAVADTVAVLRLGRNNGVFDARTTSAEELVAAITGATDNVVSRRAGKLRPEARDTPAEDGGDTGTAQEKDAAAGGADGPDGDRPERVAPGGPRKGAGDE